ncbi:MAG: type IV pilin protein, partial [Gammaproteobacteria bacterium]|nr:type IV pilin protein [Gammaproteobacteria bacterium]
GMSQRRRWLAPERGEGHFLIVLQSSGSVGGHDRLIMLVLLLHVAARQEQFRLQNQHYADVHALSIAETTPGSDYRIHIVVTAAGFEAIATAAPDGKQYDDSKCWSFGIDETGRRWSRSASGIDTTRQCWKT